MSIDLVSTAPPEGLTLSELAEATHLPVSTAQLVDETRRIARGRV